MNTLSNHGENCMPSSVQQAKLIDKLKTRKENIESNLIEVNNAIKLLEENPAIESLLTSIQRVGIY